MYRKKKTLLIMILGITVLSYLTFIMLQKI